MLILYGCIKSFDRQINMNGSYESRLFSVDDSAILNDLNHGPYHYTKPKYIQIIGVFIYRQGV